MRVYYDSCTLSLSLSFIYALVDELCVVNEVLVRGTRIVIPAQLRTRVLENAHEGHPGIVRMKDRLRSKVWWPGIDAEAEKYVRTCDSCQKVSKNITVEECSRLLHFRLS